MPLRLSKLLKSRPNSPGVDSTVREYEERFASAGSGVSEHESGDHRHVNDLYYNLVTDFFEYGWGRSFHFAPRARGESFKASIARHERFLAQALELSPGMVVADLGCGVGGPLMEIARFSGSKIVGVNSNAYQLQRARRLVEEAGLRHLAEFLHCDFLHVDAPDESFDAVYSIEGTCCAPDKLSIYSEVFRLLKPGACFGAYEYCMTNRFDAQDPLHLKIKSEIELGGGLLEIDERQTVDDALQAAGFEVLETRDLAVHVDPLVSTSGRIGLLLRQLSKFADRTLGHSRLTEVARDAPYCAKRIGPRSADLEPVRSRHGRGWSARHLHPDVPCPLSQAGAVKFSLCSVPGSRSLEACTRPGSP